MDLVSLVLVALGLSADCFAVALSTSLASRGISWSVVLRTGLAFGLFQFLMPLLGWLAGRTIVDIIASYDHWVVFGILAIVGGRMVREGLNRGDHGAEKVEIARLHILLTLAVATSIDALAVGLSSAFLKISILSASSLIGAVAFLITVAGFILGKRAGKIDGKTAKLVGGLILIGIGVRILVSHLH